MSQCKSRALDIYDAAFLGLVFFTLGHATQALAGDQAQPPGGENLRPGSARQPMPTFSWMMPVPDPFHVIDRAQPASDPSSEFRPRRGSSPQQEAPSKAADDESIMRGRSIWDRLAESQSREGVQLFTLWQTGGNSLSLQAGRKGGPTIQWTSRLMSRSAASHGLLDDLFSSTLGRAAGRGPRVPWHAADFDPSARPARAADSAGVAATER